MKISISNKNQVLLMKVFQLFIEQDHYGINLYLKLKYHRWLGIFFYYSSIFPRPIRLLSLFSSIVIMLFIQSITYNLVYPNDGLCENYTDENSCLSLKSSFNQHQTSCYWVDENELTISNQNYHNITNSFLGACYTRSINKSMIRMFIVAMISAIISAPFSLTVQYIIENFLCKETIYFQLNSNQTHPNNNQINGNNSGISTENNNVRRANRTLALNSELGDIFGNSLHSELNNLLQDLSKYYNFLLQQKSKSDAKEFKGI